jgi:hypothetical protein
MASENRNEGRFGGRWLYTIASEEEALLFSFQKILLV